MAAKSESPDRRPKGRRASANWRSELRRIQAASKGSFAMGGLPRTYGNTHVMPSMPVFNLPPIGDDDDCD